jgi:hypothetical protein
MVFLQMFHQTYGTFYQTYGIFCRCFIKHTVFFADGLSNIRYFCRCFIKHTAL